MLALSLAALLVVPPHPRVVPVAPVRNGGDVAVVVDSSRHTVTITMGPFRIPAGMAPMPGMEHSMHGGHSEEPLMLFKWPVTGWARGYQLTLTDAEGHAIPRRTLHHLNLINYGRRQLFYPMAERILAVGQETPDISLPAGIGIPVQANVPMGIFLAWHNEKPEPIPALYVKLVMDYSPSNLNPRPVSVLPVYMDVVDPVGKAVDFDLPAGETTFHADLTIPAGGRIIGISGHAHDYIEGIALQRVQNGQARDVVRLRVPLDSAGRILRVEERYPGIRGNGIKLVKGATYRVTGTYNNQTGGMLKQGAMIHVVWLMAVDNMRDWPALDPDDPGYRLDMDYLETRGNPANDGHAHDGMEGMQHSH